MSYESNLTPQTLADLLLLAAEHTPVRAFGVREANLARVIAAGPAAAASVPNSALTGLSTATAGANKLQQVAVAEYSFAVQGGATGTVSLGVALPDNSLVTHVTAEIVTAPTSTGSTGTFKLVLPTDGDLTVAQTADGAAVSVNTATLIKKTTAARNLSLTIATNPILSGVVRYYVHYFAST